MDKLKVSSNDGTKLQTAVMGLLRVLYVVLCVAALLLTIIYYDEPKGEMEIILIYVMLVLTFPAGLIYTYVVSEIFRLLYVHFAVRIPSGYVRWD